jgi:hypothetical protein|tara:strand:- start:360 stop:752 length:393 start_codon:yes stop_codon:yes gene_type:complete
MEFIDSKEWVPVHTLPGFECCIEYYVNASGDIKSTKGTIERILKQKIAKTGYPVVNLTQRVGRKKILTIPVHTLVAFAFLGLPPTPYGKRKGCSVVRHIDGNKKNNKVENLMWIKRQQQKITKIEKVEIE